MLLRTSFLPRPIDPELLIKTPWLGAIVAAAYPLEDEEEEEEESWGTKIFVGEEERERGTEEEGEEEEGGASVCRAWLYWLIIGFDITTTLLFTIGFPIVTCKGRSVSARPRVSGFLRLERT
jgi:hypothetical protein